MDTPFQILEHTADLRIRARGETLQELFVNFMRGMFHAMKPVPVKIVEDVKTVKNVQVEQLKQASKASDRTIITRAISVQSPDREALLVDFLNEVLYLGDTEQEVYNDVVFTKFSDTQLDGELVGQKRESIGLQVKAATYHGLKIEERDGVFEATVVFDI